MKFANCYLLILWLGGFAAYGQSLPIRPYNIKGLPQKSIIRAIHQDKQGFLWFGGLSGLYRYDGNLLLRFQYKSNDSTSIPHNFITDFCEDENGDLVCGTLGGGIFVFDKRQEKTVSIKGLDVIPEAGKGGLITRVERSGFGSAVWCGTSLGTLIKYDPAKKYCERIFSNNSDLNGALRRGISDILELEKNKLLLATLHGLYLVDADKKTSIPASKVYPSLSMLDSMETLSLLKDKQERIFVGYKGGLVVFNTNASIAPVTLQINEAAKLLNNKPIKDLIQLDDDNILIASTDLLLLYNTKTNEIADAGGGSPKQINQFYRDNNSNLWVATEGLGLFFLNKDFSYFKTVAGLKKLSQGKKVEAIVEDKAGNWWIGTDNGLSIYVTGSNKPTPILLNGKNLHVVSIFQDNRKGIWVGTHANGVFYFNDISARSPSMNISTVIIDGKLQTLSNITSINEDKFGKIWFGSYNNSVFVYDPVQKKCWRPGNNSQVIVAVSKIIKDKSGVMWVSTWNNGFNRFDQSGDDPVNGKFVNYTVSKDTNSLSFYVTSCIMEDSKGNLWIGTVSGGLNKFDRQKNKFTKYTIENGLPSNLIYQVQEDKNNNLWISTDEGLVMLSETGVPINYREEDGLLTRSFNFLASFATNSGILGFGTIDGDVIFFKPSTANTNIVKPSIVDLKLFNLTPDAATQTIYTAPVYAADKFRLKHNQSVLTFEFTNFDLVNSENYTFAYKLDGIDNNWNYISNRKSATYTSLPPGNYQLHLRAANHLGVWSQNESLYKITVLPPWWKTWWAYLLYGVLIIAVTTGFIRYRSRKLIKENMILEEKVSGRTVELNKTIENLKATQAQLVQSEKMASLGELTAGIAHEIQNPLNFVNNFSEVNDELLKELKAEAEKGNLEEVKAIANDIAFNSEKINHHGKRADSIVKGMLQHSRNSTGQKEQTDINALAGEYLRLAYHGLRAKDKTFNATTKTEFDNSVGKINVVPQEIGRVILNLINNAFYAVDEKKKQLGDGYEPTVSVSTKRENGKVEIKVADNGSGIPQKVLDKIFQPFFTTKPTGQGTGLGLSLSYDIVKAHGGDLEVETREGGGTEFKVILPHKT